MASWLELSVEADIEAVEAVSEILGRVATGGTVVEPAFELVDEGLGAAVDATRPVLVRGYVPADDPEASRAAVETAEAALGHLQAFGLRPIGELVTRRLDDADWASAWKRHFPVVRAGRRIVVRPSWRRHTPLNDDVVIALDPGMAFGTGLHPTTRLCLVVLEALAERGGVEGRRVLDVGSGSGILSIAAAKLGAVEVVGLDTDPIAVEATVANAGRNRAGARISARQGTLPSGEGPFGVIVANLIASLLVQLAGQLASELEDGGTLIASGIFTDREGDVQAAFERAGLVVHARHADGEWVALEAGRR